MRQIALPAAAADSQVPLSPATGQVTLVPPLLLRPGQHTPKLMPRHSQLDAASHVPLRRLSRVATADVVRKTRLSDEVGVGLLRRLLVPNVVARTAAYVGPHTASLLRRLTVGIELVLPTRPVGLPSSLVGAVAPVPARPVAGAEAASPRPQQPSKAEAASLAKLADVPTAVGQSKRQGPLARPLLAPTPVAYLSLLNTDRVVVHATEELSLRLSDTT